MSFIKGKLYCKLPEKKNYRKNPKHIFFSQKLYKHFYLNILKFIFIFKIVRKLTENQLYKKYCK